MNKFKVCFKDVNTSFFTVFKTAKSGSVSNNQAIPAKQCHGVGVNRTHSAQTKHSCMLS